MRSGDMVSDVNGKVGRVAIRWLDEDDGAHWVRVEYDWGGVREAPEGCFKLVKERA